MSGPAQTTARELYRAGRFDEALAVLDAALAASPDKAEVWSNRGTVLAAMDRLAEACGAFGRALALQPELVSARANRASALLALARYEEAAADYERLLLAGAAPPYTRGNFLHCRLQACDWRDLDAHRAAMIAEVRAGSRAASPLAASVLLADPSDQLRAARILAADKYPATEPLWRGESYAHRRIRLAYVSADFASHATATLMAGLFEQHDKSRFETFAVSIAPSDASPMRARIDAAFEHVLDVPDLSDAAIAARMLEHEIDIAVDLKGYTANARPGIFAHRPAPVQVSYLGYPASMGAPFIDYIVADTTVIPPSAGAHYSERVVRLPDCYQANDSKREIAPSSPTRIEAGLPQAGFVFCCFNNAYKILPEVFDVWMRLLGAVGGSVLWLLEDNAAATRHLKHEAEARGIAPGRLVFAKRLPPPEHLARHRLADLFLDTLPYNAHTTASDALWAGLPVLTCMGTTFAARVAASLLAAVGLPELATASLADYETFALKLAREPALLAQYKARLAKNREPYPLFDTARFTRHLEAAFARMHARAARGLPPESFTVGRD